MDQMIKIEVKYEINKKIPPALKNLSDEELSELISLKGARGFSVLNKMTGLELTDTNRKADASIGATDYDNGILVGAREILIRYSHIIEFAEAEKKLRQSKDELTKESI
jgi:hypothetical protein